MCVVGGWRRARAELCGNCVDFVSFGIERHRTGAFLRGDIFYYAEFVGRVFVDDGERAAFAIRGKDEAGGGIESVCVDAIADCRRGDHFTGVGVDDSDHFIVAASEEAVICDVNREAGRFLAWGERPAGSDG